MENRVAKSSPEEQALIANIESLLGELKGQSSAPEPGMGQAPSAPPAPPAPQPVDNSLGAKAEAQDQEQAPPPPPAQAPPAQAAPVPQKNPNEEEKKMKVATQKSEDGSSKTADPEEQKKFAAKAAIRSLYKSIQASEDEGSEATDDAEGRLEDGIPEDDSEQIDDITKSIDTISKALGLKTVKKSRTQGNDVLRAIETIAKAVQSQGAMLNEVLEGMGVTKEILGESSVAKSADVRRSPAPQAGYGQQDAVSVLKSILGIDNGAEVREGPPAVVGRTNVHKSVGDFLGMFGDDAGSQWGITRNRSK